ncbi:hypothetical protein DRQ20_02560 [bacterium]|nr:MAG: hypothetical protein DRQ20_02560 [bacterium]
MEFLILGGMVLLMNIFKGIKVMKDAVKSLMGLKIPIGIVVFLVGISAFFSKDARNFFPGIMGLVCGAMLIIDLIKLIPQTEEAIKKLENSMLVLEVPIGILTIIAGIVGMFIR